MCVLLTNANASVLRNNAQTGGSALLLDLADISVGTNSHTDADPAALNSADTKCHAHHIGDNMENGSSVSKNGVMALFTDNFLNPLNADEESEDSTEDDEDTGKD